MAPWVVMATCLASIPVLFMLGSWWSKPHWDWGTSLPGLCVPWLIAIDFVCCIASPFFSPLGTAWKFVAAIGGVCAFGAMMFASFALSMLVFGGPFH